MNRIEEQLIKLINDICRDASRYVTFFSVTVTLSCSSSLRYRESQFRQDLFTFFGRYVLSALNSLYV